MAVPLPKPSSTVLKHMHIVPHTQKQKQLLAESIGLLDLSKSILKTDPNKHHHVGEAELTLLSKRVELIDGIPFTKEELCHRFWGGGVVEENNKNSSSNNNQQQQQTLCNFVNVVITLYIEKRREHAVMKRDDELIEKSPRNLGRSLLSSRRKLNGGVS